MNTFIMGGEMGDIIASLPAIRQLGGGNIIITDKVATREPMRGRRFDMIAPLLRQQPYINNVSYEENPSQFTHDLTNFRKSYVSNDESLASWQARHLGINGLNVEPWITCGASERATGRVVVTRTLRYRNPKFNWKTVVDKFGDRILFVGHDDEYNDLQSYSNRPIERARVNDLLEMCELINGADLLICNQSCPYWLAAGMGTTLVQETWPEQPNSIIPRDNAKYVRDTNDIDFDTLNGGMMIALQVGRHDQQAACELAQLIADIEPKLRSDVDFVIAVTPFVDQQTPEIMARALQPKFKNVTIIRSTRRGQGFPAGPNDLWAETMQQCYAMRRDGKTGADVVLTIEPDTCPLKKDWISLLKGAWARSRGKFEVMGHLHNEPVPHINGNAMFCIDIQNKHHELLGSSGNQGWDIHHARLLTSVGTDTNLIDQRYQVRSDWSEGQIASIRKNGVTPALMHGFKTGCVRSYARKNLLT